MLMMTTKTAAIGSRVLRLTNRGSSDVEMAATSQYAPSYPSLQLHMHVVNSIIAIDLDVEVRKINLSGITVANLKLSGPNLEHVHRSRGDDVQEILGVIGEVRAKRGLGQVPRSRVF